MSVRESLVSACLERHYIEVSGPGLLATGFALELGEEALLLARCQDLIFDGYLLVPLRAIQRVRRNVVDEFFEVMIRDGEGPVPAAPELGPLTAMGAVIREIGGRWPIVGIEFRDETLEDGVDFSVGTIVSADDLRVQIRYMTTSGHWREIDVITTREIITVAFDSPYYEGFARAARPWADAPWGEGLSAAERRVWAPLSNVLAVLGQPREGLLLRRLCMSYELEEDASEEDASEGELGEAEDASEAELLVDEARGIALTLRGDRAVALTLHTQDEGAFERFVGPFLAGLEPTATREELRAALGPGLGDDRWALGPLLARCFYDEEGLLERLDLEFVG